MPTYYFNRETEALRQRILTGPGAQRSAIKAPPVYPVKAEDGTVIPIPYEFLADEASIVVATPEKDSIGSLKTYVVSIDNKKGTLVEKMLKKFGSKQAVQRGVLLIIGALFGKAMAESAKMPVAAFVGLLSADTLGKSDAYHTAAEARSGNGKTVYVYLYGDKPR